MKLRFDFAYFGNSRSAKKPFCQGTYLFVLSGGEPHLGAHLGEDVLRHGALNSSRHVRLEFARGRCVRGAGVRAAERMSARACAYSFMRSVAPAQPPARYPRADGVLSIVFYLPIFSRVGILLCLQPPEIDFSRVLLAFIIT